MRKRLWSAFLALCLLASLLPTANAESVSLTMEAGSDTAKVHVTADGPSTLRTALYDEEGRMLDVQEQTVEAGEQDKEVPFSVEAPEGFTAKAFLTDSQNRPLCESAATESYAISGLTVENGKVRADISTSKDCYLDLRFLSDDGSTELITLSVPVEAGAAEAEAAIPVSLPEFFRVEAALKRGGLTLGSPYLCLLYTSAWKKTPEDYPAEQVVDFGGDGFAVLPEGAVKATGEAAVSGGGYAVSLPAVPEEGAVVAITVDGVTVPVKVKSASSLADGTVQIIPDENAALSDLYDSFRVDATIGMGSAVSENARAGGSHGTGNSGIPIKKLDFSVSLPNITVEVKGEMEANIRIFFDKEVDPEYVEQSKLITGSGTITLKGNGEFSSEMIKDALNWTILETPPIPLGTTGLDAALKVSIAVSVNITAGSQIIGRFNVHTGDTYQEGGDSQPIDGNTFNVDPVDYPSTVTDEFSASLGLQGSVAVSPVVPGFPLEASGDFQTGARFTAAREKNAETTDTKHACKICFEERISVFNELSATFSCVLGKLSIPVVKVTRPLQEESLWEGYHSFENDVASPLKGVPKHDSGICPNKQYKVTVRVLDKDEKPMSGVPVKAVSQRSGEVLTGTAPCTLWMYPSQYIVSATVDGRSCQTYFTPGPANRTVEVRFKPVTLLVYVKDKDTGIKIPGAAVTALDMSNPSAPKEAATGTSDSNRGYCELKVFPGTYQIKASKAEYKDTSQEKIITGSMPGPVELEMEREQPYASLTVTLIDKTTRQPVPGYVTLGVIGPTRTIISTSNSTGKAEYLIPGEYTVSYYASGDYGDATSSVTLTPGEAGTLTMELSKGTGTLTGTVKNVEGTRLSGAKITASINGREIASTNSSLDGSYSLTLGTGSYTVRASASGYADQSTEITIVKNQTVTRDFTLRKGITNWSFDETTGTLTITGTGPMENYNVDKQFSPWYDFCDKIKSVVVGEGVTTLGNCAFFECINLTSITLPDSVTSIGEGAFCGCSRLNRITIPDSVTFIGRGTFEDCTRLSGITIPDSVTSIEEGIFYGCSSLSSVTIPDSITSIGKRAFYDCSSLSSVTIPNGVTLIEDNVFRGCKRLNSVTIPSNVVSFGEYAFRDCSSLSSVTIPNSVTSIGTGAFQNCSSLDNITLPNSITSIKAGTFQNCDSLSSITIPNSVTSIEGDIILGAFKNCDNLSSITIPNSVTSIGRSAFQNCISLTSITIPNSVTSIGPEVFKDCSNLADIALPDKVTSIGGSAFENCSNLTSITIPDSVTSIKDYIFRSCSSLSSITILGEVTSIGWSAFENCSSLSSITVPDSVTSIGDSAFRGCSSLSSVTIPDSVTSIGDYSFRGCTSLTSIVLSRNLRELGNWVFYETKLTSITIPLSIRKLGRAPVESSVPIYYEGTQEQWKKVSKYTYYGEDKRWEKVICLG